MLSINRGGATALACPQVGRRRRAGPHAASAPIRSSAVAGHPVGHDNTTSRVHGRNAFAKLPSAYGVRWFPGDVRTASVPATGTMRTVNLVLATWVSAINFWAWNMIGPLSTSYAGDLSLSST